ncbi:probable tRNA (uracil-O(2)-)-methyltransferase isoform X2 [Actinia tenebrosa]|nr:probable tRNA (uracil-O(2)-)-methyltransferase isoform X2 [Actinia tenebrosa]
MEKCEENDSSESEWEMTAYRFLHLQDINNKPKISLQVSCSVIDRRVQDINRSDCVVCPSIQWMKDHLLPKLKKWAENPQKQSKGSLRLISLERYTLLYQELKDKHGLELVKNWPENTDPQKFVYEDIAIATYLIILWEEEREKNNLKEKQSFVDLGCGNGLLVYILSKEGHPGLGIDVRKRKIWDFYGPGIKLEERPLDPTASGLFPNVDWLIGNHSDELTPWIPVMAARSSYRTRYFVLPCCFYDFNCKYVRQNNKTSQYRGYLDYVHKIGVVCGFEVEEDMLRIPSTKRICHIGQSRTYPEEDHEEMEIKIKAMIRERGCNIDEGQQPQTMVNTTRISKQASGDHSTEYENDNNTDGTRHLLDQSDRAYESNGAREDTGSPAAKKIALETEAHQIKTSDFKPREQTITVRNCSHLSKSLKEFIVNSVAEALLQESDSEGPKDDKDKFEGTSLNRFTSKGVLLDLWNRGRSLKLPDVAKLFDNETLKKMKNECGGIQTLLRNHRHIFQVVGGVVQLRDWRKETPGPKLTPNADVEFLKRRFDALGNTSMCWFHFNHPDGCTLLTEQCPYAHSEDELVVRPTTQYLNSL